MTKPIDGPVAQHLYGTLTISLAFMLLLLWISPGRPTPNAPSDIGPYMEDPTLDLNDVAQVNLLADLVAEVHGDKKADALLRSLDSHRQSLLEAGIQNRYRQDLWATTHWVNTLVMLFWFSLAYFLVLGLIHYGVETAALYRFTRRHQIGSSLWALSAAIFHDRATSRRERVDLIRRLLRAWSGVLLRSAATVVVFSPAYVTAYALKGQIHTSSWVFYVLLGAMSNGILIIYAEKYFELLVDESKKGYVEAARVKGLDYRYDSEGTTGWKNILSWEKKFEGHVLAHILPNVRYLYWPTFKEQASFVITGLILVELALNIQGQLGYELLQQISYGNMDYVFVILFGLFLLLKTTHLIGDLIFHRKKILYDNLAR